MQNCYTCKYINTKSSLVCRCETCIEGSNYETKDYPSYIDCPKGTAQSATHYQQGTIQPIQIMQEQMTAEQFVGYLRGNVLKYACRIGRKDDAVKDAEKIQQYSLWLVQALRGEKIQP